MCDLGRLRYAEYIDRQRKPYPADHTRGEFIEPVDQVSEVLGAFSGGRLVGSVRLTLGKLARDDTHLGLLLNAGRALGHDPDTVILVSRLVVSRSERPLQTLRGLFRAAFDLANASEADCALAASSTAHRLLMVTAGFRDTGHRYTDPAVGSLGVLAYARDSRALFASASQSTHPTPDRREPRA